MNSPLSISEPTWKGIILALSGAVLLLTIWCLSQGITIIFMHLYYFPIVLLAYRYRWKGFGLASLLALAYLGLVIAFGPGQWDVIVGACYRFLIFVGIAAVIAYLSDRLVKAQETLRQSLEVKDQYISLAPAIILVLDRNGAITFLNQKGCEILDCIPEEVTGKSWSGTFLPEKERDHIETVFSQLLDGHVEPNRVIENLVRTGSGTEKIIRWNNTVLHDESGSVTGILGYGEDITEERWAANALRELQQFQESVITNANVWISVLDPDGTILIWNDAAETISGHKKTGVLGKRSIWKQLYPDKDYRKKVTGEIRRVIGKDEFLENFETEIRCADGSKKTMVWNTRGLRDNRGLITGYIAIGRDVTAQKAAELRAGESSRFLGTMINTLPIPVFFKDADGKYLGCNSPFEEFIGIKQEDLVGKTVYDHSSTDLAGTYAAADRQLIDNPVPQKYETQVQFADGVLHDVIICKAPFFNKDGTPGGLIGAFLDITERKRMEESLAESESFNRGLVENLPEYIAVYGYDGKILYVNPASAHALGYNADELVGTHVVSYIAEEYRDTANAKIAARLNGDTSSYEIDLVTKGGLKRSVIVRATPVTYRNTPAILLLLIDITDRKRVEGALALEKQRIESLLSLSLMARKSDSETIAEVVEDAIRLTGSTIGYLATINDDETVMTMQYWSKSAHETCSVIDKPIVYQLEKTGLWGEAVRQRRPVITNDYAAGSPYKRGTPAGHVPLVRHVNIPVFEGDHIVAVIGVGNKGADYDEGDIRQLQLLMRGWWQIVTRKRSEETIRRTNTILKTQQETSPDGILIVDESGKILSFNHRFVEIWGIPSEIISSRSDERALSFVLDTLSDPQEFLGRVKYLYEHREEKSHEEVRLKDGRVLERYSSPMLDENNRYFGRVWYFHDITERKQAEEVVRSREEQFRAIFQTQQTGLMMVDAETHTITDANAAALSMIGASRDEVIGKVCHTFVCPAEAGKCPVSDLGQEVDNSERVLIRANGERLPILKSVSAVKIGGRPFLIESFIDLSERKQMEKEISESRQLFADIISFLPDPTVVIDREGTVLSWNRAMERLSGVPAGEIISKGDHEYSIWLYGKRRPILIDLVLHPDQDAGLMDYSSIRREGPTLTAETKAMLPSGKEIVLSLVASPLIDEKGEISGAIESMRDITAIKETEAELARINTHLEMIVKERTQALQDEVVQRKYAEMEVQAALDYTRSVIEANPDLMAVLDKTGRLLDINHTMEILTGKTREELIGSYYQDHLEDDGNLTTAFQQLLDTGSIEYSGHMNDQKGAHIPLSIHAVVIRSAGDGADQIIVSAHDISRQKQDEEAIQASLDEKVLLLREIHHRVKNNLQIIISLTNLQMRQTDDPLVKQIMSETQNRVRAMSLVHEKLYRSTSLSRIDFADYTRFLATQLFSFYGMDTRRVRLDYSMGKIMVDINTAVPLGLLMNELISNALKHAFPNGREGQISISGSDENNLITLVVRDNGIGIPEGFDWKNTTSLGMRLVTSLIDQVDGTISLDRHDGTAFTITVKRDPAAGGKADE